MRMIASASALLLAVLAAGCNGEVVGGGQRPARVDVVAGDLQSDTVGKELAQPLVARVVDDRDRPVKNQLVNFVVTAGGGSVFAGSSVTNAQGEARERWTLGPVAGDTQRVEARAVDPATGQAIVFATFRAIGVPDAPAAASAVGATSRTGAAGTAVADSLAIRVVDRHGNGVPGVAVAFAAANGGSVSPATATTRADGTARAQWTLGPATGPQTATATAAGFPGVTFTAAAGPGAVARVVLTPESISFDALGQTQALTVQALDAFGNMVGGQQATIISQNAAVAALDGGAIARATGNGTTRLIATVQGSTAADTTTVTVQQTATAVSAVGATSRTGTAGTAVADSLAIRVVDRDGNGVPGVTVAFAAQNGGSLSPATATTRADGTARAQWTLGPATGQQTATATVAGLPAVTFTATAGVGAVTRVALTPESISFNALGQAQPLTVQAFDAFGNLVGGQRATIISQNSAVVALDNGAIARAVANGTTRLIATVQGSTAADTTTVTVQQVIASVYAERKHAASVGTSFFLLHGAQDANGNSVAGATFTFSSSTPNLTVSATGVVSVLGTPGGTITTTAGGMSAVTEVVAIGYLGYLRDISAGESHACAVDRSYKLYCWGLNTDGQLENGEATGPDACRATSTGCYTRAIVVDSTVEFGQVVVGREQTCALSVVRAGGRVFCSGPGNRLAAVPGELSFTILGQGARPDCAIMSRGEAYCGLSASAEPVRVAGQTVPYDAISTGGGHTCALDYEGRAYCWGTNTAGELGNGTTTPSATPAPVAADLRFKSISAGEGVGGGGFTCGVVQFTGEAYCWGANSYGQLGNGTTTPSSVPVKVSGGLEWRFIRAGQAQTCAVSSNRIYCWGVQTRSNTGVTASTATPAAVEDVYVGISGTQQFDAGAGFGCAVAESRDSRAVCWGSNAWGQLGNGTTQDSPAGIDVQRR